MPVYDYRCHCCDTTFEQHKSSEHRHETSCPTCGAVSKLVITRAPQLDSRMGVSKDFPTMAAKWARRRRALNTGKMRDPNADRYGDQFDRDKEGYEVRKRIKAD
jgi:putative FmdB family regulatory protein